MARPIAPPQVLKLETFFGAPRRVLSLGPAARSVAERVARCNARIESNRRRERGAFARTHRLLGSAVPPREDEGGGAVDTRAACEIDTLILLDRDCDLVTPMITPLTYEGLVDELLGIKNSCVKVSPEVVGADDASAPAASADEPIASEGDNNTLVSVALNSNDPLYAEVRDLNVERLGTHLGERAKAIRGSYDSFRSNKDASITEIHEFVKRIPGLTQNYRSLQTHINITERLKKTTDSVPRNTRRAAPAHAFF